MNVLFNKRNIDFAIYLANKELTTLNVYVLSTLDSSRLFQICLSVSKCSSLLFLYDWTLLRREEFAKLLEMPDSLFRLYIYTPNEAEKSLLLDFTWSPADHVLKKLKTLILWNLLLWIQYWTVVSTLIVLPMDSVSLLFIKGKLCW